MLRRFELSFLDQKIGFEVDPFFAEYVPAVLHVMDLDLDATCEPQEAIESTFAVKVGDFGIQDHDGFQEVFLPADRTHAPKWIHYLLCFKFIEHLEELEYKILHASSITSNGKVFAFFGPKESGKTTIAKNMAAAGFQQSSNDALLLKLEEGRVRVICGDRTRKEKMRFASADDGSIHASALEVSTHDNPLYLEQIYRVVLDGTVTGNVATASKSDFIELATSLAPVSKGHKIGLFSGADLMLDLSSHESEPRGLELVNALRDKLKFATGPLTFMVNEISAHAT